MGDKQTEKSFASIKERKEENRMQSFHLSASGLHALDKFQYLLKKIGSECFQSRT